jgi:hypothetical protein
MVLTVAHMDAGRLALTLETGIAHGRARARLEEETSGNFLNARCAPTAPGCRLCCASKYQATTQPVTLAGVPVFIGRWAWWWQGRFADDGSRPLFDAENVS